MVLISRIFHAKPLICRSHPLDIELLFAPFIRQFTAPWRYSLSIIFRNSLIVAAKSHPSPISLAFTKVTTALYTLSRQARFFMFIMFLVFSMFYYVLKHVFNVFIFTVEK